MPTYAPLVAGTPIVWTSSGGDKVLTLTSLATGSGRAGDKSATLIDGTKGMPAFLEFFVSIPVQSAPTDGLTIDLYLSFSNSATAGTNNPGGISGADAALGDTDLLAQMVFAGSVVMASSITTGSAAAPQLQRFIVVPVDAYVIPVIVNNSGQTVNATGTNSTVTMTPWYQQSS